MIKLLILSLIIYNHCIAADNPDSASVTGWKLGGILPMLAYDTDLGLRYGALAEIYDYGSGEYLPDYKQKFYLEYSLTTKGNATSQLTIDSKDIFGSSARLTGEINYVTEKALDFYGFNGIASGYINSYESTGSSLYKSRMYYRHAREMLRIAADMHFSFRTDVFKMFAGLAFFGINTGSVNISELNEGRSPPDLLPATDSVPGLYEQLVAAGIIPDSEKNGGNIMLLRLGFVHDSRDNESFPTKGTWAEAFIQGAPVIDKKPGYSQFVLTARKYFSLTGKGNPVFACRVSYSTKIGGHIPFYMLPFYFNTVETRDGFGSGKTIRGILRNRLAADAVFFGNFELRWKFFEFRLFGQRFYSALGAFFDTGVAVSNYPEGINSGIEGAGASAGRFHNSAGAGLHGAMNENFIVTMDLGKAFLESDGDFGFYIHMNWLF